jgi:mono/diheme cytochrome c family protein
MKCLAGGHGLARQALLSVVVFVMAGAADALAQSADVAAGHRLAESFCIKCHVITRDGPAGWTNAPSFSAIAERPTTTSAWLRGIIEKPHMDMLDLPRGQSDAADLAAYILSLKQQ